MLFKIVISEEAKLDIKEAKAFYSEINSKLGKRFNNSIIETVDNLAVNPLHFQERYRGIRISFTPVFPFGVHYILENNIITILRVFHTKRFFK